MRPSGRSRDLPSPSQSKGDLLSRWMLIPFAALSAFEIVRGRHAAVQRIAYHVPMGEVAVKVPKERRQRDVSRAASRTAILDAARRVAVRDGARDLSLRGVAAEAGFAPAALYGYFRNKDELVLAFGTDDLTGLAP